MSDRKPTSVVLPAFVALTVLLGLYVGAYYAMVTPVSFIERHGVTVAAAYPPLATAFPGGVVPKTWPTFFAPMHWLDRRIRPHVWEP